MLHKSHQNGNKKGAALFLVLIIIASLSTFGGVLMILSHNRMLLTQLEIDQLKAITLAEAGISKAFYELKSKEDLDGNGLGNIKDFKLSEGSFSVVHNSQTNDIKSTGVFNSVKRTIQIKYALN